MNWYQVETQWKRIKRLVRQRWDKLTEDDLYAISGKHHELRRRLQERYGITQEQAEQEMKEWISMPANDPPPGQKGGLASSRQL